MAIPIPVFLLKGNYGRAAGPETLLASLLRNLDKERFAPTLVVLQKAGGIEAPGLIPEEYHTERYNIPWRGFATAPFSVRTLYEYTRRQPRALLHSHDMRANLVAYLLTRFCRYPWIAHVHGWLGATHSGRWRVYERIDQMLVRYATLVLVGSLAAKEEVERLGSRQVQVIPNAVEIPTREPSPIVVQQLRAQLGALSSTIIIGVVGRAHPGKGQVLLLQALARLRKKGLDLYGLIVGEGSDLPNLQHLARELGISNKVTFTGFCPDTQPYVRAMDIVVAPSLKESLPLSVLEAMALGRPVIASQVGDLPAVITPGRNGLLVPPGDVLALSNAIESLALDASARQRMGEQARKDVATRFSAVAMARSVEAVYSDLIS